MGILGEKMGGGIDAKANDEPEALASADRSTDAVWRSNHVWAAGRHVTRKARLEMTIP